MSSKKNDINDTAVEKAILKGFNSDMCCRACGSDASLMTFVADESGEPIYSTVGCFSYCGKKEDVWNALDTAWVVCDEEDAWVFFRGKKRKYEETGAFSRFCDKAEEVVRKEKHEKRNRSRKGHIKRP